MSFKNVNNLPKVTVLDADIEMVNPKEVIDGLP